LSSLIHKPVDGFGHDRLFLDNKCHDCCVDV
jgi:hypothetical protein